MFETTKRYSTVAVILHWLIAIGIISMIFFGWYMTDLPKEAPKEMSYDLFDLGIYTWELAKEASPRTFYFNLHKSIGVTLLGLIAFRLFWRMTHKAPRMLNSYKPWERRLATGAHHILYLLMFAIPLTGLMQAVSSKYGVKWFGIELLGGLDDKGLRKIFHEAHEITIIIVLLVLILHVLGALKHKFIDKDDTMKRMSL
jgi:cytochrome b561